MARRTTTAIDPPQQQRSRDSWNRVLDAGVALLEEKGFEAFTIAAVCERAHVAAPSIYSRAANKDALLLAVYEHAHEAMVDSEKDLFEPLSRWTDLPLTELVRQVVVELATNFLTHSAFRRTVILRSGIDQSIYTHASEYATSMGRRFGAVLLTRRSEIPREDVEGAVDMCFRLLFAALTMYVTYGATFNSSRELTEEQLIAELADVAHRILLSPN